MKFNLAKQCASSSMLDVFDSLIQDLRLTILDVSNKSRATRESYKRAKCAHEGIQFLEHVITDARQQRIATIARYISFEFVLYCFRQNQYTEEDEDEGIIELQSSASCEELVPSTDERLHHTEECKPRNPFNLLKKHVGITMRHLKSYEAYTARANKNQLSEIQDSKVSQECRQIQDILDAVDKIIHLRSQMYASIPENLTMACIAPPTHISPSPRTILSSCRDFDGPPRVPRKERTGKKRNDTFRVHIGCPTTAQSFHRLFCQLSIALRHGTPSTIMLAGPRGCGKLHMIHDIASALGNIQVMDLTAHLQAEQLDEESPTFHEDVCATLDSAYGTATVPTIMVLRHIERAFITSSTRDNESKISVLSRAVKPWIQKQKDKFQATGVVFVGTTSRPDDCAGRDLEDLLDFFNAYVSVPQMDHHTRMMCIQRSFETHYPKYWEYQTPCHWAIHSALAWTNPNASWNEIDQAVKQVCENPPPIADFPSHFQATLQLVHNHEDRCTRTAEIEAWIQRILSEHMERLHK